MPQSLIQPRLTRRVRPEAILETPEIGRGSGVGGCEDEGSDRDGDLEGIGPCGGGWGGGEGEEV